MVFTKKNNLKKKVRKNKTRKTKIHKVKSKKKSNRKKVNKKVKKRTYKKRGGTYRTLEDDGKKKVSIEDIKAGNHIRDKVFDLSKYNFENANLAGINLTGLNLRDANFKGANLKGANLSYSNLSYADFENAVLEGAKLKYTCCMNTNFKDANLNNVDFEKATFNIDTHFGTNKELFLMTGAKINGADFKDAVIYYGKAKIDFNWIKNNEENRTGKFAHVLSGQKEPPITINNDILYFMRQRDIKPFSDYFLRREYGSRDLQNTINLYNEKKIKNIDTMKLTINLDDIPYNKLNKKDGRMQPPNPERPGLFKDIPPTNKQNIGDTTSEPIQDAKAAELEELRNQRRKTFRYIGSDPNAPPDSDDED